MLLYLACVYLWCRVKLSIGVEGEQSEAYHYIFIYTSLHEYISNHNLLKPQVQNDELLNNHHLKRNECAFCHDSKKVE